MNSFTARAVACFCLFTMPFFVATIALATEGASPIVGDPAAGKEKAAVCAACHGANGNSVNPQWPNLAGQHAGYTAKQLHNFKNKDESGRNNAVMYGQAVNLSDQDMADLAAYYATLDRATGVADPELVAHGEQLYRGGDLERGIAACMSCHGPRGLGNQAANFPVLAGQHAEYTAAQLMAFRAMERANDPNQMMRGSAAKLTDRDIQAPASYLQGLR